MSIDPKKAGKCWSCKHCEDVGTYAYEDYTSYMRKCTKSGHDYVDKCQNYCSDYEWDGKTPENSSSSYTSPASSTTSAYSSSTDSSGGSGCGKGCLIAVAVIVILVVIGILAPQFMSGEQKAPETVPTMDTGAQTPMDSMNIIAIVTTNSNALRMRSGPSTNYEAVGSIPKGATVIIHNKEGSWAFVEYEGLTGWCSQNYLSEQ